MRGNLYRVSTVHCAEILSLPDVLGFDWSGEAAFAKVHFDAHCAVVVTVEYADCFRSVAEGPAPYLDRAFSAYAVALYSEAVLVDCDDVAVLSGVPLSPASSLTDRCRPAEVRRGSPRG